mmetsp:Transcript_16055/g.24916  ORF Transcript_16055/g.24916 Transcript_16055/m.24916 type:complete len:146 (-) Transcript_16055:22-459(-)
MQRLRREAMDIEQNYGTMLKLEIVDQQNNIWHITFNGADGSLYQGETFTLRFRFDDEYPFESPEVMFIGTPPVHEHIYSCGFICLSTLDTDWTPALKTSSVCMSIISMLSSAKEKVKPPNDETSSKYMAGKSPKDIRWLFEDDKC